MTDQTKTDLAHLVLFVLALSCLLGLAICSTGCQSTPPRQPTSAVKPSGMVEVGVAKTAAGRITAAATGIQGQTRDARAESPAPAVVKHLDAIDTLAVVQVAEAAKIDAVATTATEKIDAAKAEREQLASDLAAATKRADKAEGELKSATAATLSKWFVLGILGGVATMAVGVFLVFHGNAKLGASLATSGASLAGCCWAFRQWGDIIALCALGVAVIGLGFAVFLKRRMLAEVVSGIESAKTSIPASALSTLRSYLHAAQSPETEKEIAKLQTLNNSTAASLTKTEPGT